MDITGRHLKKTGNNNNNDDNDSMLQNIHKCLPIGSHVGSGVAQVAVV